MGQIIFYNKKSLKRLPFLRHLTGVPCFVLFFLMLFTSCSRTYLKETVNNIPTRLNKEFRGVWIATVANIDWPANGHDTPEKKLADFINLLDFYQKQNYNAIVLQIRTAGDAFYPSKYAPWSRYYTGKEGQAPKSDIISLPALIAEVHKRGMEFHAWLNPFRATYNLKTNQLHPTHDYNIHHNWMVKYGKKYYYNPGIKAVRDHLVEVVKEVVANYDIDGLLFDDYFYPYHIEGEVFDDSLAYQPYKDKISRSDWRRKNINQFIAQVDHIVHSTKPWVHFGVSSFGVWRNVAQDTKGSATKAGQTTFDDLYADPLFWIKNTNIDFLAPQVYWSMNYPPAGYKILVDWWNQYGNQVNIYIANATYKIKNNQDKSWDKKKEYPNQILYTRNQPNINGNISFSAKSLYNKHKHVNNIMRRKIYEKMAITPTSHRAKTKYSQPPKVVSFTRKKRDVEIELQDINENIRFAILIGVKNKLDLHKDKYQILDKYFIDSHKKEQRLHITLKKNFDKYKYIGIFFQDKSRCVSTSVVLSN